MTDDDPMYEVPLSRLHELSRSAQRVVELEQELATVQAAATAQRSVISTEERRRFMVEAVDALHDRGIAEISMNAIVTTLDMVLEKLGVRVANEIYVRDGTEDADTSDGTPVCPHCGGRGVEFLTEDERAFFAYMAAQRFKTVAEKDTALRDEKRARWQDVAMWFDSDWKPND